MSRNNKQYVHCRKISHDRIALGWKLSALPCGNTFIHPGVIVFGVLLRALGLYGVVITTLVCMALSSWQCAQLKWEAVLGLDGKMQFPSAFISGVLKVNFVENSVSRREGTLIVKTLGHWWQWVHYFRSVSSSWIRTEMTSHCLTSPARFVHRLWPTESGNSWNSSLTSLKK